MTEKVPTPLDEQETIINYNPNQVNDRASVYTSATNTLAAMWKLYNERPDEVKIIHDDKYGTEFSVPRDWIKIKPKKQLTDEQKQLLASRLAAAVRK